MRVLNSILIGADFEKMQFNLLGLDLLEPMTFLGDVIIFITSIYFAVKTNKFKSNDEFFVYWKWFFIVFGVSFLGGGFGHLCFNYFGVPGKYFAWYTGIISSYLIEMAFISIFTNVELRKLFVKICRIKNILAFLAATYVFIFKDLSIDPAIGLIVPTLNSIIGLGITLGILGTYYQRKIHDSFKFYWISALTLIPSAIFQGFKINLSPWFDKNDASHVFLLLAIFFYFIALKKYNSFLNSKQ